MAGLAVKLDEALINLQLRPERFNSFSVKVNLSRQILQDCISKYEKLRENMLSLDDEYERLYACASRYANETWKTQQEILSTRSQIQITRFQGTRSRIQACKISLGLMTPEHSSHGNRSMASSLFWKRNRLDAQIVQSERDLFADALATKIQHFLLADQAGRRNRGFFASLSFSLFSCLGCRSEYERWSQFLTEDYLPALEAYKNNGNSFHLANLTRDGLERYSFRIQGCPDPEALRTLLTKVQEDLAVPPPVAQAAPVARAI
jgi:hypothetical protein